ncbi:ATP-binding cassette domain-containing protein [Streptomyces sp. NBC_01275]|uniref:ATP-binding cassette domain-containing protein n=1 Tax=Streptomyces sp. NBC_01275 TaxID=2903807 RepID=UPI002258DF6F|nr:ATP-binding cassette domain-containing protein [Streptomyces sp. NBC_01275]MCX4760236.1 ATP-binding cassette domain-containing protein [Streptomyces sp. NBC_01275]
MTSTHRQQAGASQTSAAPRRLPPPPPAELRYGGRHGRNPLEEATFAAMCRRLPSVLTQTARMAWAIDRRAVLLLAGCQLAVGVSAAVLLTSTARAMRSLLAAGEVADRVHQALPALVVIALAAGAGRIASALSSYADGRITPRLTTEADSALVAAVCRMEAAARAEDGCTDRQEAAEMGVVRSHLMVQDATRFTASVVRMVTASGVLSVLHPLMLPLLLLAVVPSAVGAVLHAKVTYETHYANVGDRNVRQNMRGWATTVKFTDEIRANGMTGYLVFWYRAISERIDARILAVAPRMLRIVLASSAIGGVFLVLTWAALAWLAATGRVEAAIAATAVVAVQTTLAALSQFVVYGAAMFHSSLYLADMDGFLDYAARRAPDRGESALTGPLEEIRVDEGVYRYPGKESPAVAGVSLTVRRGEILAVVGENGSGKSTLTRLLAALFLPDKGTVRWNGHDVAGLDPDRLWDQSGLVPQHFAQWPLSVRDNVTLGQPRAEGDDLVWQALDAVGLREAVEELPNGLDTLLARELWGGTELSGGQWQRLACARALYRRAGLLILDEPTSQMDARGEHRILEQIKALAGDCITIVVTHQLVNTRIADRIIVMEHGRIAEQGAYDELAHGGGLFAELLALSHDR